MKNKFTIAAFLLFVNTIYSQIILFPGSFLNLANDAKGLAMGKSGVATDPDNTSIFWNPAKQVFSNNKAGASFTYLGNSTSVIAEDVFYTFSGYYNFNNRISVMGGTRLFIHSPVSFYNRIEENFIGPFKIKEHSIDFATAVKISPKISTGFTVRNISSNMGKITKQLPEQVILYSAYDFTFYRGNKYKGDTINANEIKKLYAMDMALYYNDTLNVYSKSSVIAAGIVITNRGDDMWLYDYNFYQPSNINSGISLKTNLSKSYSFVFVTGLNIPITRFTNSEYKKTGTVDRHTHLSNGIEIGYKNSYFIRSSYFTQDDNYFNSVSKTSLLSSGIGYKNKYFSVDFSGAYDFKFKLFTGVGLTLGATL